MEGCLFRRVGREPLTERHVQAAWYDRDLRPARLTTRDGEELRVIHPGTWNVGPGPDFSDAVIELGRDGRRIRGDVEVHLRPSDWETHRHGDNPAYRNVILHVTWGCGPEPPSLPSGAVSVWFGRFLALAGGFMPEQVDITAYPFARLPAEDRPCQRLLANRPDLSVSVLAEAGACRLAVKADRLRRLLVRCGSCPEAKEQLFYTEVMSALGYRGNASGFRQIAKAVPLSVVRSEPENAAAAFLTAATFVDWPHGPVRPRNRPQVRLRAAAELLVGSDVMGLMRHADFSPSGCRRAVETIRSGGLVGHGRAAAIVANVLVPWAIATGRISEPPTWLPVEDLSEPMRLTAFRLFGRDHNPRVLYAANGLHAQGLLHIYRSFCLQLHPACEECQLGAQAIGENMAMHPA